MLTLHDTGYTHPNGEMLFDNINLTINKQDKIALIGNNGVGKSTLLSMMNGHVQPSSGWIKVDSTPYYVPQLFGQYNDYTIAQALRVEGKLTALREILEGHVTDTNLALLDDHWSVEEQCYEALSHWGLTGLDLFQQMATLSGGQKTKVFLSGIDIHQPHLVLLDEPSNHLDTASRGILYDYIKSTTNTLVVVSHDRTLLNLLDNVCELTKHGIAQYGGNYDFYVEQKEIEANALAEDLKSKEKALRKAKETERKSMERQQKLDARGKKKQEKAGVPTIAMNTLRNNAEKSTSRMKDVHTEKVGAISKEVNQLRKELPDKDKMKMDFDDAALHHGKILIRADAVNFGYNEALLWQEPVTVEILSGERIAVKGVNGSGKTTLIRLLMGALQPISGMISRSELNVINIDQDYSLINNQLSVYDQAQEFNSGKLQEHEVKSKLTHFLFTREDWDKPCKTLSGGEKMRLVLCCLTIKSKAPDMIILDEPTNNLDIQNIEILTEAIKEYNGTVLVISHDAYFLAQIAVSKEIELK